MPLNWLSLGEFLNPSKLTFFNRKEGNTKMKIIYLPHRDVWRPITGVQPNSSSGGIVIAV